MYRPSQINIYIYETWYKSRDNQLGLGSHPPFQTEYMFDNLRTDRVHVHSTSEGNLIKKLQLN